MPATPAASTAAPVAAPSRQQPPQVDTNSASCSFLQLALSSGGESSAPNVVMLASKAILELGRGVAQGSLVIVKPKISAAAAAAAAANSPQNETDSPFQGGLLLGVQRDPEQDRLSRGGSASSTYARLSAKTIAAAFPCAEVIVTPLPASSNRTDVPDADSLIISIIGDSDESAAPASFSAISATDIRLAFERTIPRNAGAASILFPEMRMMCPIGTRMVTIGIKSVKSKSAGAAAAASGSLSTLSSFYFVSSTEVSVVGASRFEDDAEEAEESDCSQQTSSNLIVCSGPGQGKSHRLGCFAEEFKRRHHAGDNQVRWISGGSVSDLSAPDRVRLIRSLSSTAAPNQQAPSLLILDDVDFLLDDSIVVAALRSLLSSSSPSTTHCSVAVVAMSCGSVVQSVDTVRNALLTGSNANSWKVESIVLPSPAERIEILKKMLSLPNAGEEADDADGLKKAIVDVGQVAHGFSPLDLRLLVDTAVSIASRGDSTSAALKVTPDALRQARRNVQPTALRSVNAAPPPSLKWTDIGGSDEAKAALQECLVFASAKSQRAFARLGVTPPRGILLFGPPGNSKTMLAKAVASAGDMNFISVKGPEVFSKWVGDSEKAVRDIFDRARAAAPCVVFIDELDGMCGKRGGGGVGDRVISQLLVELDGMKTGAGAGAAGGIVFIAATNRPDCIDDAILRPGRIDKKIYVGLPELHDREKIFGIALRGIPLDAAVSAREMAERTAGYTGAEVVSICKRAAALAVHEEVSADDVKPRHFDSALAELKPRISQRDVDWYTAWARGTRR